MGEAILRPLLNWPHLHEGAEPKGSQIVPVLGFQDCRNPIRKTKKILRFRIENASRRREQRDSTSVQPERLRRVDHVVRQVPRQGATGQRLTFGGQCQEVKVENAREMLKMIGHKADM